MLLRSEQLEVWYRAERSPVAHTLRRGLSPLVPATVLAQVWRGGPQASLSRLLAGCTITPLDERIARAAGTLCGQDRSDDMVDGSVVVLAQMLDASVVNGDATDLRRLAPGAASSEYWSDG